MITKEYLIKKGFKPNSIFSSPISETALSYKKEIDVNDLYNSMFYKKKLNVFIYLDFKFIKIEVENCTIYKKEKTIAYKGKLEDENLFDLILKSILAYYY